MPELPDLTVYIDALAARLVGRPLKSVAVRGISLLRSYDPPLSEAHDRRVTGVSRIGKRVVIDLDGGLHLVIHLMVAGRFRWLEPGKKPPGRITQAIFELDHGSLVLTEAGKKRRATLHLCRSDDLASHDRGGLEPLTADLAAFTEAVTRENRTLKRALTDPRLLAAIGNSYSDEILHRARLSPVKRSRQLKDEEILALYEATKAVLVEWIDRLRSQYGDAFPTGVTAFRDEMAVHGRFGKPCPDCGDPVQRIVFAQREHNYCATCQTGGKLLRDRALSQLLRKDWPRTLEELEARK